MVSKIIMNTINKIEEINFQKCRAESLKNVQKTPFRLFQKYRRNKFYFLFIKEFLFKNLKNLNGKYVCDLGCGEGELSVILAKLGAKVFAIDISDDLIKIAKKRAQLDGVDGEIEFVAYDIEKYIWNDNVFDFVISYGVLHHINIMEILPKVNRILKDTGKFILIEPINFLPNLQKFVKTIKFSTKEVSVNEKALTIEGLREIKKYFKFNKVKYFNFFGRISRLMPGSNLADYGSIPIKAILFLAYFLDFLISSILPPLNRVYRVIVVVCQKK